MVGQIIFFFTPKFCRIGRYGKRNISPEAHSVVNVFVTLLMRLHFRKPLYLLIYLLAQIQTNEDNLITDMNLLDNYPISLNSTNDIKSSSIKDEL